MQMQSSLELAEKEHRKMFEKITERAEEMKKLMTEVQSSPQLAEEHRKMFEKIAEHAEEMKLAEKEHRKMFEKIAEHAEEMKVHSFDSMVDQVLVVSATVYLEIIPVCEITRS
uniref:Uncharacterized protein n=2 Tax=Triticum urartu TaxID=4572 RepID=A0A8R7QKR4_TRIUA